MRSQGQGLEGARRILVYGVTGSGKTTLARRLSAATGLPLTEVDEHTWRPAWVPEPVEEQRRFFGELCAGEAWVLDSAYSSWSDLVLSRADLVVGLDHPRWLSLGRLVRRTLARNLDKREICNGNVETWRETFSRDSILLWHFRSFASKRTRLTAWEADPAMPPVLRLRSSADADAWLSSVELPVGTGSR